MSNLFIFLLFCNRMLYLTFLQLIDMLPDKFKGMLGIKDEKDLKMANNIWKMLDQMSQNDPASYQKFLQKNLREGLTDAKQEKQKKQKPYKLVPQEYMLLQMDAMLEQQYFGKQSNQQFKQKLDININKQKWSDVKAKFPNKIRIYLNICHTERIRNPTSRAKNGQEIKQFHISMLKDIENLYYSLQGPLFDDKNQNNKSEPNWYFCIIFNTGFLRSFDIVPNGRKILLGLSVAYFQQRLKSDRNPVLMKVNTHSLYGKNLYYGIQKSSIEVNQGKKFKYGKEQKVCQFLLEKQIDKKQIQEKEKDQPKKQEIQKKKQKLISSNPVKSPQILIRPKQEQKASSSQLPSLIPTQQPSKKKVLIEVLEQKQFSDPKQDTKIPFEMKETQDSYIFEFLVHGIEKIEQLDLEVSSDTIKLRTLKKKQLDIQKSVQIPLKKKIDDNKVKAKMKKKTHTLQVILNFTS